MTTKQDEKLLLTPEESKPYWHIYRDGGHWHINELLEAQLAKAKPIIEKQERERIIGWLYQHNTLKELDHAKHQVGLDLTCADWQELQGE